MQNKLTRIGFSYSSSIAVPSNESWPVTLPLGKKNNTKEQLVFRKFNKNRPLRIKILAAVYPSSHGSKCHKHKHTTGSCHTRVYCTRSSSHIYYHKVLRSTIRLVQTGLLLRTCVFLRRTNGLEITIKSSRIWPIPSGDPTLVCVTTTRSAIIAVQSYCRSPSLCDYAL